ncbi:cholinesterase-like [Sycon ciliatum]|uniref:cholinesterase-like n=1 Tax=Sycon ciliatum TaxID=27933 RepID=UPI0031F69619
MNGYFVAFLGVGTAVLAILFVALDDPGHSHEPVAAHSTRWSKRVANALLADMQGSSKAIRANSVEVRCPSGLVSGERVGEMFDSFYDVPYATAGRWQGAREVLAWHEPVDARKPSKYCVQASNRVHKPMVDRGYTPLSTEDCLVLNIHRMAQHAPEHSDDSSGELVPVMVWVHGGSFNHGVGSLYDGTALSAGNVLVVTVNYRLGVLGFLRLDSNTAQQSNNSDNSAGHNDSPTLANFALTDISAALHWIQRNIAAFGGDPKKVTLFGESAGGALVGWMLLGKDLLPRDMIRGAILQSGTPNAPWAWRSTERAEWDTQQLSAFLDCKQQTLQKRNACLRNKTASEVMEGQNRLLQNLDKAYALPTAEVVFASPIIDRLTIEKPPDVLMDSLSHMDFPVVIGRTKHEMSLFVLRLAGFAKLVEHGMTASTWSEFMGDRLSLAQPQQHPFSMQFPKPVSAVLQTILNDAYSQSDENDNLSDQQQQQQQLSKTILSQVITLWSDTMFACPAYDMAHALDQRPGNVVYSYCFSWQDGRFPAWAGAAHTAELDFVFGAPMMQKTVSIYNYDDIDFDNASIAFSEQVMDLWTAFTKDSTSFQQKVASITKQELPAPRKELDLGNDGVRLVTPTELGRRCKVWKDIVHPLIGLLDIKRPEP